MSDNSNPNSKLVLFHKNCNDGWVAALQAYKALGTIGVDYVAIQYGESLPDLSKYSTVYMLDFSCWPLPQLDGVQLIVLDHHKTAIEGALRNGFPGDYESGVNHVSERLLVFIDPNESGASLACEYFSSYVGCNLSTWLVDYARDHDLWLFEEPNSRAVRAGLGILPKGSIPDDSSAWLTATLAEVGNNGRTVLAYSSLVVDGLAKQAVPGSIGGIPVRVVNTGYDPSGVGHRILELSETNCSVAAMWFATADCIVVSLRSRGVTDPKHIDVSQIASRFAGGGHPCAAGFRIPFSDGERVLRWVRDQMV